MKNTVIFISVLVVLSCLVFYKCSDNGKRIGIKKYYKKNKIELDEMFRLAEELNSDSLRVNIWQTNDNLFDLSIWLDDKDVIYDIHYFLRKSTYSVEQSYGDEDCSVTGKTILKRFISSENLHKILAIFEKIQPKELEICRWHSGVLVSPDISIPFKSNDYEPVLYFESQKSQIEYHQKCTDTLGCNVYIAMVK